jgi:hypothetical protein
MFNRRAMKRDSNIPPIAPVTNRDLIEEAHQLKCFEEARKFMRIMDPEEAVKIPKG